jgi:hypothetical protein
VWWHWQVSILQWYASRQHSSGGVGAKELPDQYRPAVAQPNRVSLCDARCDQCVRNGHTPQSWSSQHCRVSVVFMPRYNKFLPTSGHFCLLQRVHQGMVLKRTLTHLRPGRIDVGPAMAGNKGLLADEGPHLLRCLRCAASSPPKRIPARQLLLDMCRHRMIDDAELPGGELPAAESAPLHADRPAVVTRHRLAPPVPGWKPDRRAENLHR